MTPDSKMIPAERHGLKVVSMGMLTGEDKPAVLRGPMVGKFRKMFVEGVQWGPLDYLILDLPPGTGDTQLTLAQSMPLSGAVIVTTPQAVSLKIARRGLRMFEKVQVKILGVVENMRTFTCPHCGDPAYAARARQVKGHIVVGGSNYGQGSSREHAALGPQFLGLRAVLAKGLARIHSQNLINFGVLPLTFVDPADYDGIQNGDVLRLAGVRRALAEGGELVVENVTRQRQFQVRHFMSPRQAQLLLSGGLINWMKERLSGSPESRGA